MIKKILEPIYLKLDKYFSQNELVKITKLGKEIKNLMEERNEAEFRLTTNQAMWISVDNDRIAHIKKLDAEIKSIRNVPIEVQKIIEHYDKKYPTKHLTYKGRPIVTKQGTQTPEIYLPDYIFDFRSLREIMHKRGLTMSKYVKKYPDSYATAVDKLREDIYTFLIRARSYMLDKDQFGPTEFWSGPFISWYLKQKGIRKMDCEDSSLLLMSLFKAAGIPRGLQRAICGKTYSGFGHCAVAIYSLRENRWYHYESTGAKIFSLKSKKEGIGIKDTWFSFDWEYSWTQNPKTIQEYKTARKVVNNES